MKKQMKNILTTLAILLTLGNFGCGKKTEYVVGQKGDTEIGRAHV